MSRIIAAVAVAIIAIVGLQAVGFAYEGAGRDVQVTNEQFTPSTGGVTVLDDSQLSRAFYEENVTVMNNSGTIMDRGDDYRWFASNGTVLTLAGGGLDGDTNASINYAYDRASQQQESWVNIVGQLTQLLGPAVMIGILILLLIVLARVVN